ncbi:hypothetical protein LCGC14_0303300 [marine sediment metagenome]|uniref:Nucleotidyl transferase domain-containing protein n=1 Tax=marine sediment metagenome TaxID=412755 RepID=A0A0F9TUP6_9ZZZZ
MKAVILAGGRGKRLYPYTTKLPKPLVPIGKKPIIRVLIDQLLKAGTSSITLATGHLSYMIEEHFRQNNVGLEITFSKEEKRLGTAAPLKQITNLPKNFLVLNGDLLTDLDFRDLYEHHTKNKNMMTIATYEKKISVSLGVLELSGKEVVDYFEKPSYLYPVSMGIYVMEREVLDFIPENTFYDIPDLVKELLSKQKKIGAYLFNGRWLDIGTNTDYQKALELFENEKEKFTISRD